MTLNRPNLYNVTLHETWIYINIYLIRNDQYAELYAHDILAEILNSGRLNNLYVSNQAQFVRAQNLFRRCQKETMRHLVADTCKELLATPPDPVGVEEITSTLVEPEMFSEVTDALELKRKAARILKNKLITYDDIIKVLRTVSTEAKFDTRVRRRPTTPT